MAGPTGQQRMGDTTVAAGPPANMIGPGGVPDSGPLPRCACPPPIDGRLPALQSVRLILREKLAHFTVNLAAIADSDNAELVHQARVGWRRFASSVRFFKPLLPAGFARQRRALADLRAALRVVREADVALQECLPPLASAYAAGDAAAARHWQRMLDDVAALAAARRAGLRQTVGRPGVQRALAQLVRAVERLPLAAFAAAPLATPGWTLPAWSVRRLDRLARRLRALRHGAQDEETLHRQRILAKRLRYEIESLRALLPPRLRKRGLAHVTRLQARIGRQRDLGQAATLVARWPEHRPIADFLRGLAAAGHLA